MKDETILAIAAILAVTVLETMALMLGIDGSILTVVVAAIAGLGGYMMKASREKAIYGYPVVLGFSFELDSQAIFLILGIAVFLALIFVARRLTQIPQLIGKGALRTIASIAKSTGSGDDMEAYRELQDSIDGAIKGDTADIIRTLTNPITLKAWANLQPVVGGFMARLKGKVVTTQSVGFAGD